MKQSIQQLAKKLQALLRRQETSIQNMKKLSEQVDMLEAEHLHTQIKKNSSSSVSHE